MPPLPRRKISLLLGSIVLSLGLTGCPGNLDPSLTGTGTGGSGGGGGTSGVCDAPTMVLASPDMAKGCGSEAACHGANAMESGLDLVSPGVIGRLLDKTPTAASSVSCGASTMPYLISGTDPAMGLMIDKLNSAPSCGSPMPFPVGNLPATQRTCLLEWARAVTTGMITQ
ncbi:MAG TPA: hypothetical protein VIF57_08635 [Polyangia bacterium]